MPATEFETLRSCCPHAALRRQADRAGVLVAESTIRKPAQSPLAHRQRRRLAISTSSGPSRPQTRKTRKCRKSDGCRSSTSGFASLRSPRLCPTARPQEFVDRARLLTTDEAMAKACSCRFSNDLEPHLAAVAARPIGFACLTSTPGRRVCSCSEVSRPFFCLISPEMRLYDGAVVALVGFGPPRRRRAVSSDPLPFLPAGVPSAALIS